MSMQTADIITLQRPARPKFSHPGITSCGSRRATVELDGVQTLWFNTGTLCNIECTRCYIKSSPTNDALVYLTRADVENYLGQLRARGWPTREIGFTGGEPFMNPQMIGMAEAALEAGFDVLILTNAMRPMMRPRVRQGLLDLGGRFGKQLTLRVSMDHFTAGFHDLERGSGSFEKTLTGMRWLSANGFRMHVAGRTIWNEDDEKSRAGYAALFEREGFAVNAQDPAECVLFPEMDEAADVPEITTDCWSILGKSPKDVMCSSSRMVVRRKGADQPTVLACTLITEDPAFEFGPQLKDAERPVPLNHPHCSKFCVLGGARCSG